jgi:hypothetical protein
MKARRVRTQRKSRKDSAMRLGESGSRGLSGPWAKSVWLLLTPQHDKEFMFFRLFYDP